MCGYLEMSFLCIVCRNDKFQVGQLLADFIYLSGICQKYATSALFHKATYLDSASKKRKSAE